MQGFFISCIATFQFLNHWAFSHIIYSNQIYLRFLHVLQFLYVMTDWQTEKGKSEFIIRKEWDFFFYLRHIEISNNVMITSIRNKTEWSTIQGVVGRNFELDCR